MRGSGRGGIGKKGCTIGKSCGATCIDAQERCNLELGPLVSESMRKARDWVQQLDKEVYQNFAGLDSSVKTVDWLDANKKDMSLWGLTQANLDHIIKLKPQYVTFGIEPHSSNESVEGLRNMKMKGLSEESGIKDTKKNATGALQDLIFKANTYKLAKDVTDALHKMDPEVFPSTITDLSKQFALNGRDPERVVSELIRNGLVRPDGTLRLYGRYAEDLSPEQVRKGKINWAVANKLIMNGAGVDTLGYANPSGLWKPSTQYGQFAELYKAVGRDPGPFRSNSSWYNYASKNQSDGIMRIVREAKPKMMYFGGGENKEAEKRIGKEFQDAGTIRLQALSKDGKPVIKSFRYNVYKHSDGTRTVAIFGPHPGAMGFSSNRSLMQGIGEVAKGLAETGRVPAKISSAEVL